VPRPALQTLSVASLHQAEVRLRRSDLPLTLFGVSFICRLIMIFVGLPLYAAASERADVLVVIGAGSSLPDEFEDDVGEPLSFTLSKSKELAFAFLPMDRVRTELGYGGAAAPESCVFDNEYLRF